MKKHPMTGFLKFEFIMFCRNFVTVFFLLLFPTMMLLIFGSIYGNEPSELYGGYGSIDMFVPAYSGIVIAVTGLMNIPLTLCEYREKGIFKRYYATPTKPSYLICSQLLINALMTTLGMAILIVVGKVFYNIRITSNYLQCLLVFAVSILCIFSIGFFIGGIAPNMKAANSIAYFVFFPMLFLSGATIPYEILPSSVQSASKVLPLSYTVSAMKSIWNGNTLQDNIVSLIILCGFAVVFAILSKITFRWEKYRVY